MRTSKATKTIRCASCGKRIREHHPDLEVLEASGTGRVRHYHERCGGAAYAAAERQGGVWLATYRSVEHSEN